MSSSWSWLNFRDFSSVAGKTDTGIVTRPNEMAPFHIERGGMADLLSGAGPHAASSATCGSVESSVPRRRARHAARARRRPRYAGPMPARNARARKTATAGRAFTVGMPSELPAERQGDGWWTEADGRELRLSNLDKLYWTEEGYTKGDLLNYYFNVSELLLPYLRDRPLTMKRMPDGVNGPFFYEKTAPSHTPDWIARCPVQSEDSKDGVIGYMMVQDLATLLFVVNLGAIEMHPLHSRCPSIESPDYLFFDLDPMGASFD